MSLQQEQLNDSCQESKLFTVVLIGDSCIDEYQYGTVERLSPEAPIPIFCPKDIHYKDGMAANVKSNLKYLGLAVRPYFTDKSIKVRMIDSRSKQHILRVDHDKVCAPVKFEDIDFSGIDALVISDYNKGTVTYELIEQIQESVNVPIFVDTKKTDLRRFNKCFIKINELEYKNRSSDANNMIVTHGSSHVQYGSKKYLVPAVPVFDVCGAGDTFLAALVYQYLNSGKSIESAIEFAIKAAAVTVQHMGVYAPTLEEIL